MQQSQDQDALAVLVLAAGRARRFGADKRRVDLSDRHPLLESTIRLFDTLRVPVYVCLADRPGDRELAADLAVPGRRFLFCARADRGMGATLAEAVLHCEKPQALMIALGDMPLISETTLARLGAMAARDSIVYPVRDERRGHPVVFGSDFFPRLMQLDGDAGAAPVIRAHPDACRALAVDDPGIHQDIDSPEALQRAREILGPLKRR